MSYENKGEFTKREILSQPETWQHTIEQLRRDWSDKLPQPSIYDHVIFTGCGSTYYLSTWAARLLQKEKGISAQSLPSSELWYATEDWVKPHQKILLVAISRSGETTETLHAVESFSKINCGDVVAITCYPESKLAKAVPLVITTPDGQEKSIAQTRSFTNMMWVVLMLIDGEIPEGLGGSIRSISKDFLDAYIETAYQIGRDTSIMHFFFLGNGPLYGLASEVMLKMKEMSLSYSEAYHFLEFRHGPMSVVNEQSLIVGFMSNWAHAFETAVLKDMKKLGALILGIGLDNSKEPSDIFNYHFGINQHIPANWIYPLYLPLLQLTAFERALSKGLNPDKPKNLTAVVELI